MFCYSRLLEDFRSTAKGIQHLISYVWPSPVNPMDLIFIYIIIEYNQPLDMTKFRECGWLHSHYSCVLLNSLIMSFGNNRNNILFCIFLVQNSLHCTFSDLCSTDLSGNGVNSIFNTSHSKPCVKARQMALTLCTLRLRVTSNKSAGWLLWRSNEADLDRKWELLWHLVELARGSLKRQEGSYPEQSLPLLQLPAKQKTHHCLGSL